jgi:radical SAM protein with 4Fe4S-binding SPASM domain
LRLNKARIRRYNQEIAPALAERALALGLIQEAGQAYPFGVEGADFEASKNGGYALGLYRRQPCYMPWLHALISPRGRVYACCMLRSQAPLGNLVDDGGFRQVWQGPAYGDFRRQMLDAGRRPALCHSCDDFSQTNGRLQGLLWPALAAAGQDG